MGDLRFILHPCIHTDNNSILGINWWTRECFLYTISLRKFLTPIKCSRHSKWNRHEAFSAILNVCVCACNRGKWEIFYRMNEWRERRIRRRKTTKRNIRLSNIKFIYNIQTNFNLEPYDNTNTHTHIYTRYGTRTPLQLRSKA